MSMVAGVPGHQTRILIVDDQRPNRQLLQVMLASEGYQVDEASSGEEALARVAQHPPDLILLDVMMPIMNGFEVATALKSDPATTHIPIVMVTAIDDRESRMRGLEAGAEDFISKPVERAELRVRVRNLLRLQQYSQTLEAEVVTRTTELEGRRALLEHQSTLLTHQAALLDLTQDAIVVRELEGRILFWSRGAEVMTGWSSTEAVGRITFELLQTTLPAPLLEIQATLLRLGQWEGEVTHQKRDGTRLVVSSRWALERDAEGAPHRVLSINTDISQRKQADAERKQADAQRQRLSERLSLATRVARVGVSEWDRATNSFIWDDTMFDFYGLPPVTPLPYGLWTGAVHPEDLPAVEASLHTAVETKGSGAAEFRITRADGVPRTISTMGRVMLNDYQEVTGVIGVHLDVTDRKASEAAVTASRNAESRFKDEFLSHVSHELRSPLTAIKQFTTILAGGLAGELTHEQLDYQQIVMKNVSQLQAMIDDLLEVTRLETGKLTVEAEQVSVSEAAIDAVNTHRFTATAKGVTIATDVGSALPGAYADPTRLRQILIILLDNALKFTGEGGRVTVAARRWPDDPTFLLLTVTDTGCGISPEIAEKIFQRLYQVEGAAQTSRKGLGLGIYICKQLVTRQGGAIWLDSTPGRGSTFSFTLPVFDLTHLIAPLLKHDRWPRETAALVEVRTSEIRGESAVQPGLAWCQQVAGVVQGCLMPNLDVLLPPVRRDGVVQFFAAAFADEHGARVLTRRIREQLDRHQAVTPAGTTTSVSYQMLPPVALDGDADMEAIVGAMVGVIEASIPPVLADDVSRSRCAATAVVPRTLRDTASPPQGEIVGTEQPPPALSGGGA